MSFLLSERKELMKGIFQPMKSWYSTTVPSIRDKYGPYPLFWQDLETWEHFKNLKKIYLAITERLESGKTLSDEDILSIEKQITSSIIDTSSDPPTNLIDSSQDQSTASILKKKRNRWGAKKEETTPPPTESAPQPSSTENPEPPKPRKSRFAAVSPDISNPPTLAIPSPSPQNPFSEQILAHLKSQQTVPSLPSQLSQEVLQQTMVLNLQLQQVTSKLLTVALDAARIDKDPNRSPSPPPKYDSNGKRTNTREVRMREQLTGERIRLIEDLMSINPTYQPPPDYVRAKPVRRIPIPQRDNPLFNFIGLIIGPRGNTQKQLEQETGCKISIRGRGSVKEGSKNRQNKLNADEDEDLHVHIQGENEQSVEIAAKRIMDLLNPDDADLEEHKQKQLRELALINGTLKEEDFCQVCGDPGHKQFECPHRAKTYRAVGVKCSICGDVSHPTRDCPFSDKPPTALTEVQLDSEYDNFVEAISGKKSEVPISNPSPPSVDLNSLFCSEIGSSVDISLPSPAPAPLPTSPSLATPVVEGNSTIFQVAGFEPTPPPLQPAFPSPYGYPGYPNPMMYPQYMAYPSYPYYPPPHMMYPYPPPSASAPPLPPNPVLPSPPPAP